MWIWQEAAAIASVMGVPSTAQALRLTPRRLEAGIRARAGAGSGSVEKLPFVELEGGEVEVLGGVTVEIERREGAHVRVHGARPEAVARVATLLLGSARS